MVLVLAASGCGGESVPSRLVSVPNRAADFGTDVSAIFFMSRTSGAALVDRELAAAATNGLRLARANPLWEFTEPGPPRDGRHRYDWRFDDFIAGRLAAHGFRWIAVLSYAPSWASVDPAVLHGAPRTPADFAAYAGAFAKRFHGPIAAYEVWNEENSAGFWRPAPDPVSYASLYMAARAAIHHADPGVPVLVGGLANENPSFLPQLLQQPGLRNQLDGIAIHPYGRDPTEVLSRVRGYRQELHSIGAGDVPLYVTEYGWSDSGVGGAIRAPAAQRGSFIGTVARDLLRSDCDVRMAIFFAWFTAIQDPAAVDQGYGVARSDSAPTSATLAVARTARALVAPGLRLRLCGP